MSPNSNPRTNNHEKTITLKWSPNFNWNIFIVNQLGNFYGRRKSNKKSEALGLLASRQLSCFGGTHEPRRPHSQAGSPRRLGRVVSPLLSFRGRRPYTCKRDVWPKVKPTLHISNSLGADYCRTQGNDTLICMNIWRLLYLKVNIRPWALCSPPPNIA